MKKRCVLVMALGLLLLCAGCTKEQKQKSDVLTLDRVTELAEKGSNLSWDDFAAYESEEIGSGLYILHYAIDDDFYLLIGGGSQTEAPMYIRLVRTSDNESYIDIRTDDVQVFLNGA